MKLTFLGAAHEVTGSRYLLEACGKNILVDYGMEQGANLYENAPLPLPEEKIDYVFLTHAHIDHSGHLPLLYKNGFRGGVYATAPTADLCRIMLQDSAHIQESDAEYKNRKAKRSGKPLVEPLYTCEHALGVCELFRPCPYQKPVEVCPGLTARFVDVGHLLGSASIELTVVEGGQSKVLVFSGDVGNLHQPLLRDPQYMTRADIVVMESTYGDRSHGPRPDYIASLTEILQTTLDRGGNIVVPSFAVGRTQELLYFIRHIKEHRLVKGHDGFPVYVDSPLSVEATKVFNKDAFECADEEALALLQKGVNPLVFDDLHVSVTAEESKRINDDPVPKVIISSSGMCDAGRIRHHLKHNLWRPESTICFVGYQSNGTLGRQLADGAKEVRIFGEDIQVNATITTLAGVSGHADQAGLLTWVSSFEPKPQHVFVTHGEDQVTDLFAGTLNERGLNASAPYNGESWDLNAMEKLCEGNRQRIANRKSGTTKKSAEKASAAYEQLLSSLRRLTALVEKLKNGSSKEQLKLSSSLNALVKKFSPRR